MQHLSPGDRQKLVDQLKRHEGTKRDRSGRHIAYRCTAGALTIGYGHNLDANPVPGLGVGSTINDDQAERLLMADLEGFARELETALPWVLDLAPARYAVLLNMAFNLGIKGLLGFRNTLGMIQRGQYADGGAAMMRGNKWMHQVGDGPGGRWDRAEELAKQMSTGTWQKAGA